jgi:hypothetical protein
MRGLFCVVLLLAACSSSRRAPVSDGPGGSGGGNLGRDAAAGEGGQRGDAGADRGGAADGPGPDGTIPVDARIVDAREPPVSPDATGSAGLDAGGRWGIGGGSLCANAALALCESFETTAPGALPAGWARRSGYGGKSMAVAADDRARGQRALKIEGGLNGSQFLERTANLGGLATSHWGRIFYKVKTPAPWPTAGVLHGDIVQHLGPHPGGGVNGVRWGIVENTQMKFQWIYNVQPTQGEPEFGDGTAYDYTWPGTWQCLEWHYDQPTQQAELWLDGAKLPIQVGKAHAPEIPVFTSLGVGWSNYQNAPAAGFTVWIDEVAFDPTRITCDR